MTGYAVIDVETTGIFYGGHDRIVEIAIVLVDPAGHVTGEWETLVNPGRDLGAQRIHGIEASHVLDAPRWADIAPTVLSLVAGRVVVAHNARFDVGFLQAEMLRMGECTDDAFTIHECTMVLARDFLPGVGRSLADCCDACGIEIGQAHRAISDARATAELLGVFIDLDPAFWDSVLTRNAGSPAPAESTAHAGYTREQAGVLIAEDADFLARLTSRMQDSTGPVEHQQYHALLDRCLLDRHLSATERRQLIGLANDLSISSDTAAKLHQEYFDGLVAAAWADGIMTAAESADVARVGELLRIDPLQVVTAINTAPELPFAPAVSSHTDGLPPGTVIVLTGDMNRPRDAWHLLLIERGFVPKPAVTKAVGLVVAADPDSLSGKAKKARDYGIPIVSEAWLAELLLV